MDLLTAIASQMDLNKRSEKELNIVHEISKEVKECKAAKESTIGAKSASSEPKEFIEKSKCLMNPAEEIKF
jgi:hypothetical protein